MTSTFRLVYPPCAVFVRLLPRKRDLLHSDLHSTMKQRIEKCCSQPPAIDVEWYGYHRDAYFFSLFMFSATLNLTICLIRPIGSGSSMGNCTAPFELLYFASLLLKTLIPLDVE